MGSLVFGFFLAVSLMVGSVSSAAVSKFDDLFQPSWAMDHFVYEGDLLKMKLDNYSGIFKDTIFMLKKKKLTFFLKVSLKLLFFFSSWPDQGLDFHPRTSICLGKSQCRSSL